MNFCSIIFVNSLIVLVGGGLSSPDGTQSIEVKLNLIQENGYAVEQRVVTRWEPAPPQESPAISSSSEFLNAEFVGGGLSNIFKPIFACDAFQTSSLIEDSNASRGPYKDRQNNDSERSAGLLIIAPSNKLLNL